MAKTINLKPEEEITSVIERLWETGEEEIFLVAPKGCLLLKNIIGLKLLKREADRLGKELVIITKDEVGREMAKRVGLSSRVSLPKQKEADFDDEEVFHEVSPKKFEALLEEQVEVRRHSPSGHLGMSDIRPKGKLGVSNKIIREIKREEIITENNFDDEEIEKKEAEQDSDFDFSGQLPEAEPKTPSNFSFAKLKEEDFDEAGAEDIFDETEDEVFDKLEDETEPFVKKASSKKFTFPKFSFKRPSLNIPFGERRSESKKKTFLGEKLNVPFFSGKFLTIFISAALLVALATLYFILPKADIEITPKSESISQSLNVLVDKSLSKIDSAGARIPAQLIKLDKSETKEFEATGQRQVNEKAKGTITVYNEYSSSPQSLVEKTRFTAENGKVFKTTKTVTVPGAKIVDGKIVASSIDIEVVADQPGSDYNVGPGRFSIPGFSGTPKFDAFYGQSKTGIAGGASGLMKVVSQEDYDKAKNSLWESLSAGLGEELKRQIPSGLKLLDFAFKKEIVNTESSTGVGQPADSFTLSLKGSASVILFDEKDIEKIINKKVADKIGGIENLIIKIEQSEYQQSGSIDFSKGQMSLISKIKGKAVWPIDAEAIKKDIAGKNEASMREYFGQNSEVAEVKVSFWPFWVKSVPVNVDKIGIKVLE